MGNSINSTTSSIVSAVSNTIINANITANSSSRESQTITVDCTAYASAAADSLEACFTKFESRSTDDIRTLCNLVAEAFPPCGLDSVDISQSLTTQEMSDQGIDVTTSQVADLTANLTKSLSATYGIGSFGDSMNSTTSQLVSDVQNIFVNSKVDINKEIKQQQTLYVSGNVTLVSISQAADVISSYIQKDTASMTQAANLSDTINEAISQQNSAFNTKLGLIIGGIVIFIVVIIVLRLLLRRASNKKVVVVEAES